MTDAVVANLFLQFGDIGLPAGGHAALVDGGDLEAL
jgi:hypothetical protein